MLLIKILFRATFDHAFPCHTDGIGNHVLKCFCLYSCAAFDLSFVLAFI